MTGNREEESGSEQGKMTPRRVEGWGITRKSNERGLDLRMDERTTKSTIPHGRANQEELKLIHFRTLRNIE